jgi:hypothetical protein
MAVGERVAACQPNDGVLLATVEQVGHGQQGLSSAIQAKPQLGYPILVNS